MKKSLKTVQNFPVVSGIFSIVIILYLVSLILALTVKIDVNSMASLTELTAFYNQNPLLISPQFILSMLALYFLLLTWDVQRFMRMRKLVKRNSSKLRKEIDDVWESKKHLQNKAHTYSGHADKLKLFISDKLLEYIEYDEKFLHFKSIASEVRHNGVISYDIVTSLLTDMLKAEEDEHSIEAKKALEAMRYLWDLLDLSTADNIALHIANLLINAEEQSYQMMLEMKDGEEGGKEENEAAEVLIQTDFSCVDSVKSTLTHLVHDTEAFSDDGNESLPWSFEDDQFKIRIASDQRLLGNANHVRLVLENLLKNAQHFSRKVSSKQKSDRILLSVIEGPAGLAKVPSYLEFQVYNRGPLILDEHKKKLFQLGYSTRRTREHHGKGLGLFFVNEIVKGYEGQLTLENINNQPDRYSIRISLKNGDVDTQIVNVVVEDSRPYIELDEEKDSSQRWQYNSPIESIEVSSQKMHQTVRFSSDEGSYKVSENLIHQNEEGPILLPPCWSINIQPKRRGNKTHNVTFNALDIAGVRFSIKLPTAQARIEGLEPDYDNVGLSSQASFINDHDELAELQENFKPLT
jgi:signal transduction histidine kinase